MANIEAGMQWTERQSNRRGACLSGGTPREELLIFCLRPRRGGRPYVLVHTQGDISQWRGAASYHRGAELTSTLWQVESLCACVRPVA